MVTTTEQITIVKKFPVIGNIKFFSKNPNIIVGTKKATASPENFKNLGLYTQFLLSKIKLSNAVKPNTKQNPTISE